MGLCQHIGQAYGALMDGECKKGGYEEGAGMEYMRWEAHLSLGLGLGIQVMGTLGLGGCGL